MSEQIIDQADSPWKELIELYFKEFMAFFFPNAHADIDWDRGYEFLDKELQQIVRDAELGRRLVDKLVKVYRSNLEQVWVLIHIEVQGQYETEFAKRMYIYNYRLFDRYDRQVASFAVLCDESKRWRPQQYGYTLWGSSAQLKFAIVKLLDYEREWDKLESSNNPFAVVVMAHLKTKATKRKAKERLRWKFNLVKMLYEKGYNRQEVLELFRFIDWIMILPDDLERKFELSIAKYEEERLMPYVTNIERRGIQQGIQQGLEQGLEQGVIKDARESVLDNLETRFGVVNEKIIEVINKIADASVLKSLRKQAITVSSQDEFEKLLPV